MERTSPLGIISFWICHKNDTCTLSNNIIYLKQSVKYFNISFIGILYNSKITNFTSMTKVQSLLYVV